MISTSTSDSCRRLLDRFPVPSFLLSILPSASGSVWIVDRDLQRYVPNSNTSHTTARHFPCAVSYACSGSLNQLDQLHTSSACTSTSFCSKTPPTQVSHALVSNVYLAFGGCSYSIGSESSTCCTVSTALLSDLFSRKKWKSWCLTSLWFRSAVMWTKSGTNRENKIQRSKTSNIQSLWSTDRIRRFLRYTKSARLDYVPHVVHVVLKEAFVHLYKYSGSLQ